jgi:hypothetical protein
MLVLLQLKKMSVNNFQCNCFTAGRLFACSSHKVLQIMPSKFSSCVFGNGLLFVFPKAENYSGYSKESMFLPSETLFSIFLSKTHVAAFVIFRNFCNGI